MSKGELFFCMEMIEERENIIYYYLLMIKKIKDGERSAKLDEKGLKQVGETFFFFPPGVPCR